MANFDFIEAASNGYQFVWEKRVQIARVALIPFVIKLVCFIGVTAFAEDENYLRHGLYLLPSYFAEGWLVIYLIRIALLNEAWPGSAAAAQLPVSHQKTMQVAVIVYVLIKLVMAFVAGYVLTAQAGAPEMAEPSGASPYMLLAVLALFAGMLWAFRLVWLYVPAALGYGLKGFLLKTSKFSFSLYLIGAWLLCFVPLALLLIMVSKVLSGIFPGVGDESSLMFIYSLTIVQAALELIVASISSVAIAHGIKSIYDGTNRSDTIF